MKFSTTDFFIFRTVYFEMKWYYCTIQVFIRTLGHVYFFIIFFSISFLSRTLTTHRTAGKERGSSYSALPLRPTHEHSDINLQLCIRDDYHIFNHTACIYQTATWWDLPLYRTTFDWLMTYVIFCLFTWRFDSRFLLQQFDTGNRWTWTRIDYHPCITIQANWLTKCAGQLSVWTIWLELILRKVKNFQGRRGGQSNLMTLKTY